jgi:hypothetical protein
MNKDLDNIIIKRIPPYLWDMIGYICPFIIVINYNKQLIIIYSLLYVVYGFLNIIFELFTYTIEYSPINKEIGNYNIYLTNKKFKLNKYGENELNNNKLIIDLNIYNGNSILIKNILLIIYSLGITKKNYTIKSKQELTTEPDYIHQFNSW